MCTNTYNYDVYLNYKIMWIGNGSSQDEYGKGKLLLATYFYSYFTLKTMLLKSLQN